MTATAERVLREIQALPPADLLEVRERVNRLVAERELPAPGNPASWSDAEFEAAIEEVTGCCEGRDLNAILLRERASERDREDEAARFRERERG